MKRKKAIIAAIEELKRDKPPDWKKEVKSLLRQLAQLDDPFREHEWHGTEVLGRSVHRADCPSYDRMGDNSWP